MAISGMGGMIGNPRHGRCTMTATAMREHRTNWHDFVISCHDGSPAPHRTDRMPTGRQSQSSHRQPEAWREPALHPVYLKLLLALQIGRASCRERLCRYVEIPGG